MDILDFFWTFYLNHLSPLQGYFWIKLSFGIGHPPQLYIKYSVYVSGRVQGSQIFKQNSIISIRSKVMAFLVILFPWSQRCPHRPRVIPISSPSSPHCPHSPRRSPCGPYGCGLRCLHHMLSPRSLWSPHRARRPHIIPVSSPSSPHCPHSPQKVPM